MSDLMKEWRLSLDHAQSIEEWRRADQLANQVGSQGFSTLDEVGEALSLTKRHLGVESAGNPSEGHVGETWLENVVSSAADRLKSVSALDNDFWSLEVPAHSVGADQNICAVSRPWCQLLGYNADEVIGRRSVEFLTEESRNYATDVALPEFWRRSIIHDVAYDFVHKNGDIVPVLLSAFVIRCADHAAGGRRSFATITPKAIIDGATDQAENAVVDVTRCAS